MSFLSMMYTLCIPFPECTSIIVNWVGSHHGLDIFLVFYIHERVQK